jgi:transcriptional regulator with XRE-family HTH domain
MSMKDWERKVLERPHAAARVAEIEDELRLAAGLTALRERAGLSQRDLANRMQVSQPRVVAIERSRNVTFDVLEQYVGAIGGRLELTVYAGGRRFNLLSPRSVSKVAPVRAAAVKSAPAKKVAPVRAAAVKSAPAKKVAPVRAAAVKSAPTKKIVAKVTGKTAERQAPKRVAERSAKARVTA